MISRETDRVTPSLLLWRALANGERRSDVNLPDVIAPLSVNEFVNRHLGQEMLLRAEGPGRFAGLLSWNDLNSALNRIRASGSRLRLMQDGKAVPRDAYLASPQSESGSPIKAAEFERLLANGATLVLDAVDELFPPIRELADTFEDLFHVRVQANLYAGWRTQHGFDLHFDDHDTMILQVHGRKHWKVYSPTRLHPLKKGKDVELAPTPARHPVWDGILENGGLLYMPRGWWHVACPLDEPSLHLTFGLAHPTGAQMLAWFVNGLKAQIETRMDVPHLKGPAERRAWLAAMRDRIIADWNDDVLDRFMSTWDSKAIARSDVHLPDTAARDIQLGPDTRLRLASGRRLTFTSARRHDVNVSFLVNDKPWTCPVGFVPALGRLNHLFGESVRDLSAAVQASMVPALKLFLTALAMGGAISVEPAASRASMRAHDDTMASSMIQS
jgi:ribosomal protein L16 Arg81 hydroxylase